MPPSRAFIPPCVPTVAKEPPTGDKWLHEVKFDGWRVQIHKIGDQVRMYSRKVLEFSSRFPNIGFAARYLPAETVIIDAEVTACDEQGLPDFRALLCGDMNLCVWCFDILLLDDNDLRVLPYIDSRAQLAPLIEETDDHRLRFSEAFADGWALLKSCVYMNLEGIVSKRADRPYCSGPSKDWIKVKCPQWREENRWRQEFFAKK